MLYNNRMNTRKTTPKKVAATTNKKAAVKIATANKTAVKSVPGRVILDPAFKPRHRSIAAIRSAVRRAA